jgi:hypothetical protein
VTIYAWRKRFGQLMAVDVKRLLQLEAENARLKKMLVERVMDIEILNEVAAKNGTLQRGSTSFESRAADAEEVQTATECNNQPEKGHFLSPQWTEECRQVTRCDGGRTLKPSFAALSRNSLR